MTTKIRFHLDENVDHAVALGVRLRGVDATTSTDAGLVGASDEEQFAFVRSEQRVLVTHDADFLRPEFTSQNHSGVVYCPKDKRTIGELVRSLTLMVDVLDPNEMQDQMEFL